MKLKKIKTAIIVDYMGHDFGAVTPEMEIKTHIKVFNKLISPSKLKVQKIGS